MINFGSVQTFIATRFQKKLVKLQRDKIENSKSEEFEIFLAREKSYGSARFSKVQKETKVFYSK